MRGDEGSFLKALLARSKRDIPHYYLAHDVDMTASEKWLTEANASRPPENRLLMGVLALKAVQAGVAVSIRGGGLVAPALHDVDRTR
jgi:pyruvate dehydrogenase E2 component (dihydrolipoamide acetyltransferase)